MIALAVLTPRQRQIVALVADGLTDAAIGCYLGITSYTVHHHLHEAFTRTGLENRVQLAVAYDREVHHRV